MDAHTFEHSNAMPAPTWHRLQINDVEIRVPEGLDVADKAAVRVEADESLLGGAPDAFVVALAQFQNRRSAEAATRALADDRAILKTLDATLDPANLDVPALSAYEAKAVREEYMDDVIDAFEFGMGLGIVGYLELFAASTTTLVARRGESAAATVQVSGQDGCCSMAHINVVAEPYSELSLTISLDSPEAGAGLVGVQLRVFAGFGSRVNITSAHTLDDSWLALDNTGMVLDEGARVTVNHRMLGAQKSYVGLAADLRGDSSRIDIDTRYFAAGSDERDFNYIVRHRGKKTQCNIDANGVLSGTSKKTLRGTIDLVHGCKGAEGSERETVLLVDEGVENKTIPVILCDEDDVAGNHGATIGHVRPEQLFYLGCRGLSPEAAEGLFATAMLEETALTVEDPAVRAGVERIAAARSIPYVGVGEED